MGINIYVKVLVVLFGTMSDQHALRLVGIDKSIEL